MRGILLACGLVCAAGAAPAEPRLKVNETSYYVTANSLEGLKQQMRQKGPKGYWGYTSWRVEWSARCDVDLRIDYTLPVHRNDAVLSAAERKTWRAMLRALTAHEKQHGQHGINAAYEIERANCNQAMKIVRKWAQEDVRFDKRTDHGKRTGAVLD